jgi:hypothetical protein
LGQATSCRCHPGATPEIEIEIDLEIDFDSDPDSDFDSDPDSDSDSDPDSDSDSDFCRVVLANALPVLRSNKRLSLKSPPYNG